MNIAVIGRNKSEIEKLLKSHGFSLAESNPDFAVSYGGDGTLMKAEEIYPGVPKIVLKDSQICKKCSPIPNETLLEKVKKGEYTIEEMPKLVVKVGNEELHGLNDIVVHNKDPRHAMRYRLSVNGRDIGHEIIGDGIVVATPFGSTAYYRSITDSFFETGIGLAFNNSTEQFDHMLLKEESVIVLTVARGPAIAYADNQEKNIPLETGDTVTIQKSKVVAKIVVPKA